jgi:site-specific DNA-methyltransferase (adenine-specific)
MADFDKNRFDSKTIEWETPLDFFEPLNKEFNFTLDVCATHENKKVDNCFTLDENGLSKSWKSNVCWMNPPYGREMIKWLEKAKYEADYFDVTTVCLIPARTNTSWWHKLCIKSTEIRFVLGRPKFGGAKHGLPFPLAIVIFSKNEGEYCKVATYNWRITYKY